MQNLIKYLSSNRTKHQFPLNAFPLALGGASLITGH